MESDSLERLLLEEQILQSEKGGRSVGNGFVDANGNPVSENSGGWRACLLILCIQNKSTLLLRMRIFSNISNLNLGTECCERMAYYGIAQNLVTYLTKKLHEGNVAAARNVSTWQGTCYVAPLVGAVLADAYWGRYKTIAVFSSVYVIGMGTLTLSASVPAFKPPACDGSVCKQPTPAQRAILFTGLYVIALGTGGIKPCVSSFGADQFDDSNPVERVKQSSFFNWFYLCINIGSLGSSIFLVWIQDNLGWGLGFGIPTVFMGLAIISFFLGTSLYRFQKPGGSPLTRMCQVIVASFRKLNVEIPPNSSSLYELPDKSSAIKGSRKLEHTDECRFLDRAAVVSDLETRTENFSNPWRLCTVTQVEELKTLVRMFPIWATNIFFSAIYAQISTMFVEQGMVMDTTIGSFTIPPASLSSFGVISVIVWVPIYDMILVPTVRRFTGNERGFSVLQRMGIGLFISILSVIAAASVEIKRLEVAKSLDLTEQRVAIPISILWQIPQFFLVGAAEVFVLVGQLEFFYDQSPDAMRTLCRALALLTMALGIYLNSFILTVVTAITTRGGRPGWIPDNLNEGHLDYFFWLLAGLSFLNLLLYLFFSTRYTYKRTS